MTIWIDGVGYVADAARNVLDVCLARGIDLPYFCWHPALGSIGACRQCAIKQFRDERDERGRIVMACMTPAQDGSRFSVEDEEARTFRRSVVEWLMINHPHDCPVCDEGGECHLQDMTVMTGHALRRHRFEKKTYRNQDLGPLVTHEMNRCIQCYRCVRYYEHAGGKDLAVFAAHDHVYFGRAEDGVLESELSGNLVEICPTGVFTDKTLVPHYTRKWDLETAPSVCVHCSVGCNVTPGARSGTLRRIRSRYNEQVNGWFLCDRGRYGYEFTRSDRRVRVPQVPHGTGQVAEPIGREEALLRFGALLGDPDRVVAIGSPRASLETNYALRRLVGAPLFHRGVGAAEAALHDRIVEVLRTWPVRTPSLREMAECDAVLVLGEDVSQTAPLQALALRQCVRVLGKRRAAELGIPLWNDQAVREVEQDVRGPLTIAWHAGTRLDDVASRTVQAAPEDIARLGFAVAREIDPEAPAVHDLDWVTAERAVGIAAELLLADRPLVVSGTGTGNVSVIEAAACVAWALARARKGRAADLAFALPECNSMGVALMGGEALERAFEAVHRGEADTVVIVENDLYRRASRAAVDRFLGDARHVVVIDHLAHETAARADLLLPAATFAEGDGSIVNHEGRCQRQFQVHAAEGEELESWRWIDEALQAAGRPDAPGWQSIDDVTGEMARTLSVFAAVPAEAPPASTRLAGARAPRRLHRYSGRTAEHADRTVHEPAPPPDPDSPFAFSMEGYQGTPPAALTSEFWVPGWNSIQALTRFQQEPDGPLRDGTPGVRLIEPTRSLSPYSGPTPEEPIAPGRLVTPAAFSPRKGRVRLLALYHAFGSEELSVLSPGVAALTPEAYVVLSPADAEALGARAGELVTLELPGATEVLLLRLRIDPSLPHGTAGVPVGVPGSVEGPLPEWGRLAILGAGARP